MQQRLTFLGKKKCLHCDLKVKPQYVGKLRHCSSCKMKLREPLSFKNFYFCLFSQHISPVEINIFLDVHMPWK